MNRADSRDNRSLITSIALLLSSECARVLARLIGDVKARVYRSGREDDPSGGGKPRIKKLNHRFNLGVHATLIHAKESPRRMEVAMRSRATKTAGKLLAAIRGRCIYACFPGRCKYLY